MKIVIDAFGGDNAPLCVIDGTIMALDKFKDLHVVLTGDKEILTEKLKNKKYDKSRIEIIHAPEVITNDDVPTDAIRHKKNSSLVVALDYLKNNEDCKGLISAGSTGAVLTGGFLKIGRMKGVSRPALAPLFPTRTGGQVVLIDCGANVDCKPINLCHFALMGSEYFKTMFNVEHPRVALLSNGVEDAKMSYYLANIKRDVDINFDLNFRPMTSESSPKSLFLGAESLPQTYVDGDEAPRLTLRPYTCFTRYDEDPIRWQTMASLMNPPRVTGRDIYVPFTIHGFGRATSGGAGTSFTFSMEDVLLSIFSKTYRYRKHNAKHATAWKNYLEPGL